MCTVRWIRLFYSKKKRKKSMKIVKFVMYKERYIVVVFNFRLFTRISVLTKINFISIYDSNTIFICSN